MAVRPKHVGAS